MTILLKQVSVHESFLAFRGRPFFYSIANFLNTVGQNRATSCKYKSFCTIFDNVFLAESPSQTAGGQAKGVGRLLA
jgi:hypothetical protein